MLFMAFSFHPSLSKKCPEKNKLHTATVGSSYWPLIPADRCLIQIDEYLFGFEILFEPPRAKLAAKTRLFVTAPRRFDVGGLHMVDPDDSSAQRFHHAKRLIDVASPNGARETIRGIVGDSDGIGLAFKRNHGSDRAKNFFSRNARVVVHVVEN